jgi:hypothetical protein
MPQSRLGVMDRKQWIGMIPTRAGAVPAPSEAGAEHASSHGAVQRLVVGIEDDRRTKVHDPVQLRENAANGGS